MPSSLLTNTDSTKRGNLLKLLRGDTISGWTVSDTFPYLAGSAGGGRGGNGCCRIEIEADPTNGGTVVYDGDGDVDSTHYGQTLLAGTIVTQEAPTNIFGLGDHNLVCSANNGKISIRFDYA